MDFCYVWLRRLIKTEPIAFAGHSTRNPQELTGNEDMGRGIDHFAEGLSFLYADQQALFQENGSSIP